MADIRYYDVILKPVITEKSMAESNLVATKVKKDADGKKTFDKNGVVTEDTVIRKYTFLVHPEATKGQIKEAVEKMFDGAKVAAVNTMNLNGKKRRRGMTVGRTAKKKKAIVTLTEDSADINLFEGI